MIGEKVIVNGLYCIVIDEEFREEGSVLTVEFDDHRIEHVQESEVEFDTKPK